MGRKIPKSSRHKKIKAIDPFYTGERKRLLYKNADKINIPPKDDDYQEIPKKLLEMMELKAKMKDEMKGGKKIEKKKKKRNRNALKFKIDDFGEKQPGMKIPLKEVPKFEMKSGENVDSFVIRVGKVAQDVINQTKVENKFDVDFIDNKKGGVDVRKRRNIDQELEYEIRKKTRGMSMDKQQKLSSEKTVKRKIKEQERKLKQREAKLNKIDEFKLMEDNVSFGEVAMEPPSIKTRPFKCLKDNNKPKSLLLQKMMDNDVIHSEKKKLITPIEAMHLESERNLVINEYRKQKSQQNNVNKIIVT